MNEQLLDTFTRGDCVAYFSMEIALRSEIPTYSGGLGILAGDMLRSAADMDLPLVGVTLVCRQGYFRQEIGPEGRQTESPDPWEPQRWATALGAKVAVSIEGRDVWIAGWLYVVESRAGGRIPVVLLDTNLPENTAADRAITDELYGDGPSYRLMQEVVLGIGGVRLLRALGFSIRRFHMNEGHAALLALELLREDALFTYDVEDPEVTFDAAIVRRQCIFTTHTPVEAGHDVFPYDLYTRICGEGVIPLALVKTLAGQDGLNMTRLALNTSDYINGVAERHAEITRHEHPHHRIHAITNGVHHATWTSPPFAALFDARIPSWRHEPETLLRADRIEDEAVLKAHAEAKEALLRLVLQRTGVQIDSKLPIIGFARRMTTYKRPLLLLEDLERLRALAKRFPFALLYSGKAHPMDEAGKQLIAELYKALAAEHDAIPSVFIPNYDMASAALLVSGCDVWLNTPLPPLEASGTSGMKAALNGVPTLSIPDGWWFEGCVEGVNGWSFGEPRSVANPAANEADAHALYDVLESRVLPNLYGAVGERAAVMKGAITRTGSLFHTHRAIRRYAALAYLR